MSIPRIRPAILPLSLALLLAGCPQERQAPADVASTSKAQVASDELSDWPKVESPVKADPAIEARIKEILAGMTLQQKIGQMVQAEIKSITPEEVREYYIGSILNGGGSWPGKNKHASAQDWLKLSQAYHDASMSTDMKVQVPIIWGTDAVHGHSNVYGATIFPHNIGLGAAHDAALIEKIGAATAQATRATGIHWIFAPTLAVVQDPRWGRTYESYSSEPALVREYAAAYVRGMQGDLHGGGNTIGTAKHFIGDGSTENGKDQGNSRIPLAQMINQQAAGYYGAIGAGVQTVMVSHNSWVSAEGTDYGRMHAAQPLITGALKEKMGFDGFVVSDWNGIGLVPGCTNESCAKAVNAGIDMFMVPDDWKAFIANTTKQVESGEIPMSRIDDAVTRILRVKLRAGLFERKPGDGEFAGKPEALQHRELARQAVRESLVLLKNENKVLPLKQGQRVLLVGKYGDSISGQSGGWSLTWQGTDNTNADFPNADSLLAGLREAAGEGNVQVAEDASKVDPASYDVIVAAIGEMPYAENNGDIVPFNTISHSLRYPDDGAVLASAAKTGKPVVTVLFSGRPLYTADLMNQSQAFVAAWLPGTEGKGVTDVLYARDGADFRGTLTFPWPSTACGSKVSDPAQFKVGYGLTYAKPGAVPKLEVDPAKTCGKAEVVSIFNLADSAGFALQLAAGDATQPLGADLNRTLRWPEIKPLLEVQTVQVNTQQDAKQVTWLAPAAIQSRASTAQDLRGLNEANGGVVFDLKLVTPATQPVLLAMQCGAGCGATVNISPLLAGMGAGQKKTIKVPLRCFASRRVDLAKVDVPFRIEADAPFAAAVTNVRIAAGAGSDPDAYACPD